MSYKETKQGGEKKVPVSASIDLRDLHNALSSVEALTGEWLVGMSKSEAVDTCLKALAAIGFSRGDLEEENLPETTQEAAEALQEHFHLEFGNSRQEKIIEETEKMDLEMEESLSGVVEGEEKEEKKEEKEQQPSKPPEEIFDEIRSLTTDGPNHLAGLINIGKNNNVPVERIASLLEPFVEKTPSPSEIREIHNKLSTE